jgi:hypothetical protein
MTFDTPALPARLALSSWTHPFDRSSMSGIRCRSRSSPWTGKGDTGVMKGIATTILGTLLVAALASGVKVPRFVVRTSAPASAFFP